jgi:hypothetical protein
VAVKIREKGRSAGMDEATMDQKLMRTADDVRTNPRPGDVVRIRPEWTRAVVKRDANTVYFSATRGGVEETGFSVELEGWARAVDLMAEVIHIAGGQDKPKDP